MVAIDSYAGGDGRLSPLSTPSATRAVLEAHGIGTKYTLGQNFLVNDDVLKKIVALAEVGENDRILEVGPGIGTLTIALLKHAASVIAIERDPDLPAVLADTLHPWREKFALIEKDALDVTRDDIVSVASTMVEPGGDAGCLDRASSAANETAQWAVSQSEDCLSESGYPAAPPQGESQQHRPQIVFLAPQGRPFDDAYADKLAAADHLLFICGHYEGIDERVYTLADHVISLGDYVLTSGELASMVVIDAAVRKLPGVLGAAEGPVDESFTSGLLEYPQYTRPADFRGMRVPEVLTSGNHAAIARWRREQSLARTAAARPDLIAAAEAAGRLTPADQKFLKLLEPAPTGAAEGVS